MCRGSATTPVTCVGNVTITGNLVETSDARLKTEGEKLTSALAIIEELQPKKYNFVEGNRFKYDASIPHYGFMAQEVESVLPALVHDIEHPEILEPIDDTDLPTGTLERGFDAGHSPRWGAALPG